MQLPLPLPPRDVEDEELPIYNDPEKAIIYVSGWISGFDLHRKTNCGINARLCWSTLHGLSSLWIKAPDQDLERFGFETVTVDEWIIKRDEWLSNTMENTSMFIRFIDAEQPIDGHSVISYKYRGEMWTFQAYLNVTTAKFVKGDIFSKNSLLKKLQTGVISADFDLPSSPKCEKYLRCSYLVKHITLPMENVCFGNCICW